ncbi:MAG TPA: sigma-70 family RNA polymerase sigma factor [Pseudomonadales bacterium]
MNRSSTLPDSQTDAELVSATAAGSTEAFHVLHGRFERRVYRYVRTFVRQPTLAEDVVIDTMTAVWRDARTFTGSSRVSTWILGIARHKALDAIRSGSREMVPLDEIDGVEDTAETAAQSAERGSSAREVLRALALLSEDHREVLRLAFYEELPYDEIATLLAIPTNTVKTRVFYAKQQLKRQLQVLGVEFVS